MRRFNMKLRQPNEITEAGYYHHTNGRGCFEIVEVIKDGGYSSLTVRKMGSLPHRPIYLSEDKGRFGDRIPLMDELEEVPGEDGLTELNFDD